MRCHCCLGRYKIGILYDWSIIVFSLINFISSIILITQLNDAKQSTFVILCVTIHIISHLCYTFAFAIRYEYNPCFTSCFSYCEYVLYLIFALIFSPFINMTICLTSEKKFFLNCVCRDRGNDDENKMFENLQPKPTWLDITWHERQRTKHYGYLIEFFISNIPQMIVQLSIMFVLNDNLSNNNVNESMIKFYLLLSFNINLICIIIKSYLFCILFKDYTDYTLLQLFFYWSTITTDVFTCLYFTLWFVFNVS